MASSLLILKSLNCKQCGDNRKEDSVMAMGWGDWGLRLYNATVKPAEGLAGLSADAYSRAKGESVFKNAIWGRP